jgi:hypothetical protein
MSSTRGKPFSTYNHVRSRRLTDHKFRKAFTENRKNEAEHGFSHFEYTHGIRMQRLPEKENCAESRRVVNKALVEGATLQPPETVGFHEYGEEQFNWG